MTQTISRWLAMILLLGPWALSAGSIGAGGDPGTEFELLILTASDGDVGDLFGGAVDLDGDIAVVGAVGDDGLGFDSGAAYVYERDAGGTDTWGEVAKLTASDGATGDQFGFSVAVSGDTIVVGAPFNDGVGSNSGAAYVFQRDEGGVGAWGQLVRITPVGAGAAELFGIAVTIAGDTAAVGSADGALGPTAGAVSVFERDEGGVDNWGQVAQLTASDGGAGDLFGFAVALTADTLVAGSPQGFPGAPISGTGAAYVFDRNPGDPNVWDEVAKLTTSDGDFGDLFAISVDIDGDRVVGGSLHDDELGTNAGSAYIFERDEGGPDAWGEVIKLRAFDGTDNDSFGISVVVDGERVLVGSMFDDDRGADSGSGYLFVRDFNGDGQDLWALETKLGASDGKPGDHLGRSVAWTGNEVLAGADGGEKAYFYDLAGFFELTSSCILFNNFCDRLDLDADFLSISGTWQNWDCEGANVDVTGFPVADTDIWRVFCLDPGCPLGNLWAYILDNNASTYDLWGLEGGPPAFQVQNDQPFTRIDVPCDEVVQFGDPGEAGVSLFETLVAPSGAASGATDAVPTWREAVPDRVDATTKGGTP